MLRQLHNSASTVRLRFTTSEILLLLAAVGLVCASVGQILVAPVGSGAMLLAAAAIVALVHERSSTRHTVRMLGERLTDAGSLDKLEVVDTGDVAALEHALNRIIQRARAHAEASRCPSEAATVPGSAEPRMAAVLGVGLRGADDDVFSGAHFVRILETQQVARYIADGGVSATLQSDGTVLVVCGAANGQAISASIAQALEIAQALSADRNLRFGLSCGPVRRCAAPGAVPSLLGAPCAEAIRLARMALSWHEYDLLAAEPVALLARTFRSQRTSLTLTHAAAPALPVYTLELLAAKTVAMSA